jgi:hypothetical protein
MSTSKAKDLQRGDTIRLHVFGEVVVSAASVAGGKRVKVKIALEHQGARAMRGVAARHARGDALEFTDAGYLLEFVCKPEEFSRLRRRQ